MLDCTPSCDVCWVVAELKKLWLGFGTWCEIRARVCRVAVGRSTVALRQIAVSERITAPISASVLRHSATLYRATSWCLRIGYKQEWSLLTRATRALVNCVYRKVRFYNPTSLWRTVNVLSTITNNSPSRAASWSETRSKLSSRPVIGSQLVTQYTKSYFWVRATVAKWPHQLFVRVVGEH